MRGSRVRVTQAAPLKSPRGYPRLTKEDASRGYYSSEDEGEREFASFIAFDFKNKVVKEISCAPECLGNYFTESELPFETTPAFFRADVLLKYKSDSEKYKLENRSISCRGAWYLKGYDINEAGQVHAYLCDLQMLPYEEQLYWKSFNERPKASISKRAFTSDFEGDFSIEYDSLESLKDSLLNLHRTGTPWWSLRDDNSLDRLHYPVTSSADEFANEILSLDKAMNEGFNEKCLRNKALALGQTPKLTDRSLLLVASCLQGLGFDEDHAREIVAPLRRVAHLRNKLKGHAVGTEAAALRAQMIKDHGTFKRSFAALCAECDESLGKITEAFSATSF